MPWIEITTLELAGHRFTVWRAEGVGFVATFDNDAHAVYPRHYAKRFLFETRRECIAHAKQQAVLMNVPDELLFWEFSRRRAAHRKKPLGGKRPGAGQPKKLRPCPKCGAMVSAREMGRTHKCATRRTL